MACGRPVIAFDCDFGPRELIESNKNGMLVPVGNIEQLAKAMLHLAEQPGLCKTLGSAARETANEYGWDKIIKRWIAVIEDPKN